ncbi:MAG: metal ABC transporter substrate-binding protein [Acidimicrobiales bacterium]
MSDTRRAVAALLLAALSFTGLAGCGQGTQHSNAPVLDVVTTIYPLAEAARTIGGGNVKVVGAVPPGANPRTYQPSAADVDALRQAKVIVDVGAGFQPGIEAAIPTGTAVVSLAPTAAVADLGPWLDPTSMAQFGPRLAQAFTAANPGATATYQTGARDYASEMQSLQADFQSSLSDCPRDQIVTPDATATLLARRHRIIDHVVGAEATPTGDQLNRAVSVIRTSGVKAVFSQPWVPDGTIIAAAGAAGVPVKAFDTLEGPPPGGWPKGATYQGLIEQDLGTLTSTLQCAQMGQN